MIYAIALEMDTDQLKLAYPGISWYTAYADIHDVLTSLGFDAQHGNIYFGKQTDAVQCVLAAEKLSQTHPWFKVCVRKIHMLRVSEIDNLLPCL